MMHWDCARLFIHRFKNVDLIAKKSEPKMVLPRRTARIGTVALASGSGISARPSHSSNPTAPKKIQ
jgi:hypothetical protein